jgi:hypothetical protein
MGWGCGVPDESARSVWGGKCGETPDEHTALPLLRSSSLRARSNFDPVAIDPHVKYVDIVRGGPAMARTRGGTEPSAVPGTLH